MKILKNYQPGRRVYAFGACLALLVSFSTLRLYAAQMIDPAIDAGPGPFSYYSYPTDVIGVMDAPSATLVSPEGFLYTGYGELMFFTGDPEVPIAQRVKTLLRGYLPVIQYNFTRDGIKYEFTMFAATLDGTPSGTLVDFVRVKIENETQSQRNAWFSSGLRYQGDNTNGLSNHRYKRPATGTRVGDYVQPGVLFDPQWKYSSGKNSVRRGQQVIYYFPENASHTVRFTLNSQICDSGILSPQGRGGLPKTTPVGIVRYKMPLQPHQQVTLDWKMPVIPVAAGSSEDGAIQAATFDECLPRTIDFWESILQRGLNITVPEDKVNNAFKASLIYDLIARNKVGNDYVQAVNDFHYHAFWLRDSSYISHMYDLSGYPQIARQVIDFFSQWQQPDGNFVSQGGQYDGVGQVLWDYGQHYAITRDRKFAEAVFPSVVRAVDWIKQARQNDPLHLIPATTPGDNERITGHVTGHDIWALNGLQGAVLLAHALDRTQEEKEFQDEYNDLRTTFLNVLDRVTQQTDGYIPPGLDGQHGQDWGNMLSLYPGIELPVQSPMVTATLNATRAKYQEGIMTWFNGKFLHIYLTFTNTETELILGKQEWAVEDLYNELLHTSSTHAASETTDVRPWGDRDFGSNLSPHGWFAARLRIALRDMMVREQGTDLHLLSAVSPEWIRPGSTIEVDRASTTFGPLSFFLKNISATRAELVIDPSFVASPNEIILHLPWFMKTDRVVADGTPMLITGDTVKLSPTAHHITIYWSAKAGSPDMSYNNVVAKYKTEYARRSEEWLHTGSPRTP